MWALGAVRLSVKTDETTSPERQREQIALTANVSGGEMVSRDVLIAARHDRLTRSLVHFIDLLNWCKINGKTIVFKPPAMDHRGEQVQDPCARMDAQRDRD